MPKPYKIPRSVLVVIYTPAWDVLLIRRTEDDPQAPAFWQSVTGSQDHALEPWAETAAREVWEETGIDCRRGTDLAGALQDWGLENVYPIYPRWLHRYAPGTTHNTERVFGLEVPQGTPVQLSPREHTDYRWLPYAEAADLCFSPSNAEAVLQLPQQSRMALP
ncbi:dihydroneopterin triphosphate diphosphatase [uncultured Rhodoferax sp.]|uniref:dihydroneopterin triphosphate diphosphatase n=1 Tax=uncultured Rhodoferax sp. TaxID=223188 RepID=UPI0025E27168|nr:dihydroneopterin triphosphate diphosphatase [uncultured Rhodoferax sp.]